MPEESHLADRGVPIHHFFKQNRGIAHVVTGDQMIGIVHAGWMHGEPIYNTQGFIVSTNKLYLRQCFIYVMFIPEGKRE